MLRNEWSGRVSGVARSGDRTISKSMQRRGSHCPQSCSWPLSCWLGLGLGVQHFQHPDTPGLYCAQGPEEGRRALLRDVGALTLPDTPILYSTRGPEAGRVMLRHVGALTLPAG